MRYFSFLIVFILSSFSLAYASTDFLSQLESKGIAVTQLLQQQQVPRSTVAQILNIVDCQDCYRPSISMKNTLTQSWWESFRVLPGKNFDDVGYNEIIDAKNNYYCIAHVGNRQYMNGYPRTTSPLCSGRFCGHLDITYADVIQTVFNISAKTFFSQYKVSWKQIHEWLDKQPSYIQNYFTIENRGAIRTAQILCQSQECDMRDSRDLQAYVKYCTFEPISCGMQEFTFAKQGSWPLAEINILLQQGIFTTDDLQNLNIDNYAPGKYIIDILARVKERSQCIDDSDQDKDGIEDYKDNCYLHYNPKQTDQDNDGIGNVCDDDIDNDSIKNPIGIIDDNGNITYIPSKLPGGEVYGLAVDPILLTTPNTFEFITIIEGTFTTYTWTFGDGSTGTGKQPTHTYKEPGVYVVTVTATATNGGTAVATTTVTVSTLSSGKPVSNPPVKDSIANAVLIPSKLIQTVGEQVNYTLRIKGVKTDDISTIKLQRGDGRTRTLAIPEIEGFLDTYTKVGSYGIQGSVFLKDGKKLPSGAFVTVFEGVTIKTIDNCIIVPNTDQKDDNKNGVGNICDIKDEVGIRIVPRPLSNERYIFTAPYSGNLTNFTWYFGDKTTGSGETTTHTYRAPGVYTVRVDATAPSGKIISATTSLTVGPGNIRATLVPSKFVQNVGEKVLYSIQFQGVQISDISYVNLQRGDGRTRQLYNNEIQSFTDAYIKNGGYPINGTVYLKNDGKLTVGAYVTVVGKDFCLGNTNNNRGGKCDMDKDAIPDMCDIDIDGDGVHNPMGMILFEKKDCSYDVTNTTTTIGGIDGVGILSLPVSLWDNCPFTKNPDQKSCEGGEKDSDGDGIVDSKDKCPLVGEFFNGTKDDDGCPEYNITVEFPSTKLSPGTCNACPCQYAQNDSSVAPGDRVKAILFDKQTKKPVTESQWYIVP